MDYGKPSSATEEDDSDESFILDAEESPLKVQKTAQGQGNWRGRGHGRGKGRAPFLGDRLDSGVGGEKMSYPAMKSLVKAFLPEGILQVWLEYLQLPQFEKWISKLWGGEQPPGFLSHMLTMWLYKDLTGLGYITILRRVDVGFKITHKSYIHNCGIIRRVLYNWAKTRIITESATEWDATAVNFPKRKGLQKVNLVMDSSDFQLIGRSSVSRKDPSWSHKLNAPGQRFQMMIDASGRAQALWGGYSPKVYDGDWIKIMKEVLVKDFPAGHVIADTHYETANRTLKEINCHKLLAFYHPIAKPRGRKKKKRKREDNESFAEDPSYGVKVLTAKQKQWNNNVAHVRSRVESPFGLIKLKWKALKLFREEEAQHTYLVFIAVATRNFEIG
jgi:hypothetical protein